MKHYFLLLFLLLLNLSLYAQESDSNSVPVENGFYFNMGHGLELDEFTNTEEYLSFVKNIINTRVGNYFYFGQKSSKNRFGVDLNYLSASFNQSLDYLKLKLSVLRPGIVYTYQVHNNFWISISMNFGFVFHEIDYNHNNLECTYIGGGGSYAPVLSFKYGNFESSFSREQIITTGRLSNIYIDSRRDNFSKSDTKLNSIIFCFSIGYNL